MNGDAHDLQDGRRGMAECCSGYGLRRVEKQPSHSPQLCPVSYAWGRALRYARNAESWLHAWNPNAAPCMHRRGLAACMQLPRHRQSYKARATGEGRKLDVTFLGQPYLGWQDFSLGCKPVDMPCDSEDV
eukprot:364362-Chlamydomonas_euryale.AAC.36